MNEQLSNPDMTAIRSGETTNLLGGLAILANEGGVPNDISAIDTLPAPLDLSPEEQEQDLYNRGLLALGWRKTRRPYLGTK